MTRYLLIFLLFAAAAAVPELRAEQRFFVAAGPVWPEGREREMNLLTGFRARFERPENPAPVILRLAGSGIYRVWLNGEFLAHGPARGPHGFYRVDELDLTGRLAHRENLLAIEVAGYNVNSYYVLDQPSFLQAEIVAGDSVLAATGQGGFSAAILEHRIRRVQRYSFQRTFIEAWRLAPGYDRWITDPSAVPAQECRLAVQPPKKHLPRRVPFAEFHRRAPLWEVSTGNVRKKSLLSELWRDRSLTLVGESFKGFAEDELEVVPTHDLQRLEDENVRELARQLDGPASFELSSGQWRTLGFGANLTGFLGFELDVSRKARLYVTFDEILTNGRVDFKRLNCANVIYLELEPGSCAFESIEPYTLQHARFLVLDGAARVSDVYLREFVNPEAGRASFAASDPRLSLLFEAGRQTFRQNSTDIFMDCPSRERAGWLCDSYFTARAAADLCGSTTVEKAFLENFQAPDSFPHLPGGMLPMCYPADHPGGRFIPNWAMWFVLQLEEYLARTGDRELVDALRPRVLALFDYFEPFRNGSGLLESLESWVFIEWSEANEFTQDVNYPSNMLYAGALDAASRLYGLPRLAEQARAVREEVARQSFDGEFFVDNAVRENSELRVTDNRTEVCQYFAFYFGVASPASHPRLWRRLTTDFGPQRESTGAFPEVHPAAPFIGKMLRLEVLHRGGLGGQVVDETVGYYHGMARRTETLWEFDGGRASCNHGFAGHVCSILLRDALGLRVVDSPGRRVVLRFTQSRLGWCEGSVPTPDGPVSLRWRKEDWVLRYELHAPAGYEITVENPDSIRLETLN